MFSTKMWHLNGVNLKETDSVTYLGVILANNTNAHSEQRVKATRRAFYALQGSGVCRDGVNPETMTYF